MEFTYIIVTILVMLSIVGFPDAANGSPAERKLLTDLFKNYNKIERPTLQTKDAVNVSVGLTLLSILSVDTRASTLETNFWQSLEWDDANLRWDPLEYDNITTMRIPPSKIWKPDLYLYNSHHEDFDPTFETLIVLRSNGSIVYIPPGIHKTSCTFDLTLFPYDEHACPFKLGSWAFDGGDLDIHLNGEEGADVSSYIANTEWTLVSFPATRESIYYACCPEPYVTVTFTMHLRRKGETILLLYKVMNAFISLMILLSFIMPAASGQKLIIGIATLVINICVISSINSMLPAHHNSQLAFYFAELCSFAFSSVLANMFTVYLYYRTCRMPELMRRVLMEKIPRSYLGFICPTKISTESTEDLHNPSYVGSSEDIQALIREIDSLKRRISLQTKTSQLMNDWTYLSIVLDRCFIAIYTFCMFIYYIVLFPSFHTSDSVA